MLQPGPKQAQSIPFYYKWFCQYVPSTVIFPSTGVGSVMYVLSLILEGWKWHLKTSPFAFAQILQQRCRFHWCVAVNSWTETSHRWSGTPMNRLACHLFYLILGWPVHSWFYFVLCSLFLVFLCMPNSGNMPSQPKFVALLFLCWGHVHIVNGRILFELLCVTLGSFHALCNLHDLLKSGLDSKYLWLSSFLILHTSLS